MATVTPLHVFCAGAASAAVGDLITQYRLAEQQPVELMLGPVGRLAESIRGGARAHVAILSDVAIGELAKDGCLADAEIVSIGTVGFAIAKRRGSVSPPCSSVDEFRSLLQGCTSFAFADPSTGDSSGTHMAKVLESMGLTGVIGPKAVLEPLGLAVAQAVLSGRAEYGALQESIARATPELDVVGALPQALQKTTTYALALLKGAPDAAVGFRRFLSSAQARTHYAAAGFVA